MADYKLVKENFALGNDFYLYIFDVDDITTTGSTPGVTGTGNVLAFATSVELSTEAETLDVSNKMSCRWNATIAGNNSYTINSDAMYTRTSGNYSYDELLSVMLGDGEVGWAIGAVKDGTGCDGTATFELDTAAPYYYGIAALTSLSLSAGNNEVCQCSVTLTGSGALNQKK